MSLTHRPQLALTAAEPVNSCISVLPAPFDDDEAAGAGVADVLDTQTKPCYDAHALMRRYDLISTLCEHMEALGWGPYQADHEDANGQFEVRRRRRACAHQRPPRCSLCGSVVS